MAFGIKGLRWSSVQVPMAMPKPDLVCLTGGYRSTPVLQIGADVYCDTRLIIAELDRRYPLPTLLRAGPLVNFGLQHWSDEIVFPPGAALAMHLGAAAMPDGLLEERSRYFTNLDFTRFSQDADHFWGQLSAHAALIDGQLADDRPFLLGDEPEWADICAYFPFWMATIHVPGGDRVLAGRERLTPWFARLASYGTGSRTEIEAAEALDLARATRLPEIGPGKPVSVFPIAHPDTAVTGTLTSVTDVSIVIRRSSARIGEVAVHFPRIGYRIDPAAS